MGVSYRNSSDNTSLYQWIVHSESEWDKMYEMSEGNSNIYTSICSFGGSRSKYSVNHTVSLDLDSPYKDTFFQKNTPEDLKLHKMKSDSDSCKAILSEVMDEAGNVAEWAQEHNVPIIGVFSGFGVHIHLLYRSKVNARRELISTTEKIKSETTIGTLDRKVVGDTRRLMRVPNVMRTCDGRKTHVYTVPLTCQELIDLNAEQVMDLSQTKRENVDMNLGTRPKMQVYDEHIGSSDKMPVSMERDSLDMPTSQASDVEWLVDNVLQMPCLAQRIMQPDPDHRIRMSVASRLFEMDWSIQEVVDLFSKFGWVDFDRKVTTQQLSQIKRRGYASPSCESMQRLGKCVYSSETRQSACHCYGISGGDGDY